MTHESSDTSGMQGTSLLDSEQPSFSMQAQLSRMIGDLSSLPKYSVSTYSSSL
jgi:hypothetical protein